MPAAAVLLYQRGVRATSLDDVLAAAGCGKSQLYRYFDDKADLVGAVIDRQLEFVLAAQPALVHIKLVGFVRRVVGRRVEERRRVSSTPRYGVRPVDNPTCGRTAEDARRR